MSTNHTEHYQLCLWEEDDPVQRTDFNEDNEKIERALKKKAEQSALDTLAGQVAKKAEQSALEALTGQVTALEQGRLRYKFDSYIGTGEVGAAHPNRLEFDFKPLVVIVADTVNWEYGGIPWVNGKPYGHLLLSFNGGSYVDLKWEDRAIQFYAGLNGSTAIHQLNISGRTYKYFALGVAE